MSTQSNWPGSSGSATASPAIVVKAVREVPATRRFGVTPPPEPEPFASLGGIPLLFDLDGNRLPNPIFRNQPGITALDSVSTTILGF